MKISYNWLKTLIDTGHSVEETAELLTNAGLEVEGIERFESLKGGLKGLVVGKVIECSKHPDADRLSITTVDIGSGPPLAIVCGAPNVAVNQKVIVATVGTKLYPITGEPFEIKKSKIRGASSEGMICAEDEIGLGSSHAGIMVLPDETEIGLSAADYFKIVNDEVLEIGLTPNRSDAASHLGVARDLGAILNSSTHTHNYQVKINGIFPLPEAEEKIKVEIKIEEKEGCKRYSGLVLCGVKVKESPEWLQQRLRSIGVRPINNIVDVTNFVLHELGQPLHAFDLDKIKGKKIIVKTATEGQKFISLDGVERTLKASDLMICDRDDAMCIAGVFGGMHSGVTENTKTVFLESAFFDPMFVRRTSKAHGLKTDASFRFERGTDPEMTVTALNRAANLIMEMSDAYIGMDVLDVYPEKLEPHKVAFSYMNCTELIGKEIDRALIKNIILNLGIEIDSEGSDALLLKIPRFKPDVTREADVVEEVMRIYGYNNVEVSKSIRYTAHNEAPNNDTIVEERTSAVLESFGFNEIMSLSLTKESYYGAQSEDLVKVINPLSTDLAVMRGDLLFGGLEAIAYNMNRKNADLRFFEYGRTYHVKDGEKKKYEEEKHLSLFAAGKAFKENPYGFDRVSDFALLKSVLLQLLQKCAIQNYKSVESVNERLNFGLTYSVNNKVIAEIGSVSKKILQEFGISHEVYYADIKWETLVRAFTKQDIQFKEVSKFPAVRRDLALLIDRSVKYGQVEELAFATEKKFLKEVNLFDIYEGEKLGNKKSYAVSFTLMNNEATLTDKQIEQVMDKLIAGYKEKLGAELR